MNAQRKVAIEDMKLSAYIVRADSGFSPNPFGRVCTLACCKPTIRRKAQVNDVVVGTASASSDVSGRLIYAMRVREVIPFQAYWECYPSRRPSSKTAIAKRGDNIWHQDSSGQWRGVRGALHDVRHQARDLSGENVLLAKEFFYFGRDAIEIPRRFKRVLATTQGHKNTYDKAVIEDFWNWVSSVARKRGRIGIPTEFTDLGCESQCSETEDEDVCENDAD